MTSNSFAHPADFPTDVPDSLSQAPSILERSRIGFVPVPTPVLKVNTVPTPTLEYRSYRKSRKASVGQAAPVAQSPDVITDAVPAGPPVPPGSRVLIWKQDPTVKEIGIRAAFLPNVISAGPQDARIVTTGMATVTPNVFGDLIESPGSDAFDAVHTFSVVRQVLTMYQRALGSVLPWQWNTATNVDPLQVFPHAGIGMNAFYSRTAKALQFLFFNKPGDPPGPPFKIFVCRSLDIVAHETGHAVLDSLKPSWIEASSTPQTGGLHESFGDLTSIFLALSQLDQCEAIIAQTKAQLHVKTFLSDMAEEFGLALSRPNGLRNADNDFKLSDVGEEVHDLSQVFTGAIYDILADIFAFRRNPKAEDDAIVLYESAEELRTILMKAIVASPQTNATFADVANKMTAQVSALGKPAAYKQFIKNQFARREVLLASAAFVGSDALPPNVTDAPGAVQNRRGCCGTMQLAEFSGGPAASESELQELRTAAAAQGRQ